MRRPVFDRMVDLGRFPLKVRSETKFEVRALTTNGDKGPKYTNEPSLFRAKACLLDQRQSVQLKTGRSFQHAAFVPKF